MALYDANDAQGSPAWFVEMQYISVFNFSVFNGMTTQADALISNISYDERARDRAWARRNNAPLLAFTTVDVKTCPDRVYNSWGINWPQAPPGQTCQPYTFQPLDASQDHLRLGTPNGANMGYLSDPNISPRDRKISWYTGWHITNNPRVVGVGSRNIPKYFPDISAERARGWDSYGVELISPLFGQNGEAGSVGLTELRTVVDALNKPQQGRRAMITNQCALYVNVVVPQFRVATMLAFLVLVYEEEISKMHPVCRHPIHNGQHHVCTWFQAESNRVGFVNEPDLTTRPGLNGPPVSFDGPNAPVTYGGDDFSNQVLEQKFGVRELGDAVFATQTKRELARLMNWPSSRIFASPYNLGHEERQMNFKRYAKYEGEPDEAQYPQVVQFRQAKGSLNATDIERWVKFCRDLVRLAELLQNDPTSFPVQQWQESILNGKVNRTGCRFSVFDLMSLMNYTDNQKTYWKLRMARMKCYVPGDANDTPDIEIPSPGYIYPSKDLPPSQRLPSNSGGGGSGGGGSGGGGAGGGGGSGGGINNNNSNPASTPPNPGNQGNGGNNSASNSPQTSPGGTGAGGGYADAQEDLDYSDRLPPRGMGNRPKDRPVNKTLAEIAKDWADKAAADRARIEEAEAAEIERIEEVRLYDLAQQQAEDRRKEARLRIARLIVQKKIDDAAAAQRAVEDAAGAERARQEREHERLATLARQQAEREEAERVEAERVEAERLEAERVESERLEAERLEAERLEAERLEAERVEAERVEAERRATIARQQAESTAATEARRLRWHADQQVMIPPDYEQPTEGMIAPAGDVAVGEEMTFDAFGSWVPSIFNIAQWDVQDKTARVGNRRSLCGIVSLLQSMQAQYPNEPVTNQSRRDVLNVLNSLNVPNNQNQIEETLLAVLKKWAGADFQLIVVQELQPGVYRASRVGWPAEQGRLGRNLYVHFTRNGEDVTKGHWESMKKKTP